MPRHLQALVSCFFFLALFLITPCYVLAQEVSVPSGTPVGLTAYSGRGAPDTNGFACGPNFGQTCYGGTAPPNGNINWTVDGVAASSSYDTVDSNASACGVDDSGHEMDCYDYWDESGFYSVLPTGDHVVTASISTSQDPYAAFSTTWIVHVVKAVPLLSVNCSPNPITYGNQNTNCTASQSAGTGSLSWTIDGGAWTTTGVNGSAGGFAGWDAGTYTIGVTYSGDNNYTGASASTVLTIGKSITNVAVSCSPNPITYGNQNTNCIASQSVGTGSLSWTINGGAWTTTGVNGTAGGFAGWGAGNYTIGVAYSGDNNYLATSASTILTINKSTPNVTVTLSSSSINYGDSFNANVHVDCNSNCGNVDYRLDGAEWGTVALDGNGNYSAPNTSGAVGNHTIQINYLGDANHNPASGSAILTVGKGAPPLSVSCSPNGLKVGQATTCTASIPGGTGTVAFYSPTTLTGQWWNGNSNSWYPPSGGNLSGQPVAITQDGVLNYNLAQSGSPNNWPGAIGGPAGLSQDYFYARWTGTFVSPISGTYTIGVNSDDGANVYVNGAQIVSNLGAIQGAVGNLTYMQSGTINLAAGATNTIVVEYQQGYGDSGIQLLWTPPSASSPSLLGWSVVPLDSGGHASITGPILVAGSSTVTATYSGDGNYNQASANTSIAATTNTIVDLSTDINPSNVGQGVTFSAFVHTGGAKPTGNVSFRDGTTDLGSVAPTLVSATNLLANSQSFNSPQWGGYCGGTSNMDVNTTNVTAPDGSYTATKFVAPSTFVCGQTPSWGVLTNIPGGLQEGKSYTVSVWLRGANGGENVIIALNDCSGTGVTLTTSWRRYVVTYSSIQAGIANCSTGPRGFQVLDNSSPNATFYAWGAQTEMSDHAGPYIQTDASSRSGYGGIANFTTNSLAQGTHSISAKYQGDAATVTSTSPSISQYVGTQPPGPPSISNITPTSGYRGSTVTISGMNFGASQGNGFVTFNGQNASVSSWSDIAIVVQVPVNATSGNVIVTANNVASNGVLYTVNTPAPGSTIYGYQIKDNNGDSGYAPNGNIIAYSDSVNGSWSNIGYDGVNRLTTATQAVNGGTRYLCWNYDSFGNRLTQVVSSSPCNNPAPAVSYNANNQIQGLGQQYDAAGNVTSDGTHQYLYDAEGRVCAVQYQALTGGPQTWMGYLYDAEGQRVAKGMISQWSCDTSSNGFQEVAGYVLGPNGEQMSETDGQGNWVYTNVFTNGELVATYTPGGLSFHLNDWLGTRRMDVDVLGNPDASYQSLPFGELFNPTQAIISPEHFFTGKERDTESGLDYFGARYNSSAMGRFMSPDYDTEPDTVPYAEFENPQTLNLYSYARNNPLLYNDPDGHDVNICDNNGNCHQVSNDAYTAAQKGNNGSLNVPTLDQVGMNGNGSGQFNSTSITDANGNSVGTATYVSNGPTDYYANRNGLNVLANASATVGSVKGVASFYGASALLGAGVAFSPVMGAGAGLTALNIPMGLTPGAVVGGFTLTAHAVEQAQERGVTLAEIEEAVEGVAKSNPQNGWDSVQRYYTSTCEVRVNKITGTIVTVINKIKR